MPELFGVAAVLLGSLAFYAGRHLGPAEAPPQTVLFVARLILFLVFLLPILVPLSNTTPSGLASTTATARIRLRCSARLMLSIVPRVVSNLINTCVVLCREWHRRL